MPLGAVGQRWATDACHASKRGSHNGASSKTKVTAGIRMVTDLIGKKAAIQQPDHRKANRERPADRLNVSPPFAYRLLYCTRVARGFNRSEKKISVFSSTG